MQSIFMDNYRGFTETFISLSSATFLVGENSTGKSSFLALRRLFSNSDLMFGLEFPTGGESGFGGFRDIVSVASSDRSYFSVGLLISDERGRRSKDNQKEKVRLAIWKFRDEDGLPKIESYIYFANGQLTVLKYRAKGMDFRIAAHPQPQVSSDLDAKSFFLSVYKRGTDYPDLQPVPKRLPYNAPLPILLPLLAMPSQKSALEEFPLASVFTSLPDKLMEPMERITWLAPIRTRPRRIYEGFRTRFSPEGDHTPFVIRRFFKSSKTSQKFVDLIQTFGESSGLFSAVSAHSFGKNPAAPFEVMISLHGKNLNIANVGYGVSQALPVVVDMIVHSKGSQFAIQQPEVHLHPRAQAALGDLIHFLVTMEDHSYIVETHSDFLIDRFRLRMKETGIPKDAQVIFFSRQNDGNCAHALKVGQNGQYPKDQPDEFRKFFINEEVRLLEI